MMEKARDLMQLGVRTIEQDSSIYDAIAILAERRGSGLPVTDGSTLVGIITEKDVLQLVFQEEHLPGSVEQYMTRDVVTFDEEDDLAKVWTCLVRQSYRRVPIVREGRLTGIISRTDLLRACLNDFESESSGGPSLRQSRSPRVQDAMTMGLLTTTLDAPLPEAAEVLVAHGITGLPVVDDSMKLLGALSEKDVLRLFDSSPSRTWRVCDVMTPDVVSVNLDDDLFDVCKCLAGNALRWAPVLDRGKLVGIISRADLILYLLQHRTILFQGRTPASVGATC
ncbi:MAG TPA: CBS domain-containing protein [Sedimentisphaerales bacterium]|nr:CBS domain-containing protein [Sedimentisphaerales bacterium]